MTNHKGFTLIELMIVVAVIGVLASIALPQYQQYVARSQFAEAHNLLGGARVGVQERVMLGRELSGAIETLRGELGIRVDGRHGVVDATSGWTGEDDFWIEYTFGATTAGGNATEANLRLRDQTVRYTFGVTGDGDVAFGTWRCQTTVDPTLSTNCENDL